jgi:hypothetical protein
LLIELHNSYGELFKSEYAARSEIDLIFDIHNKSHQKAVEIEAMYLHTHKNWIFEQQGRNCDSAKVDGDDDKIRHLISPPLQRMPQGSWAQIKIKGTKIVWTKSSGTEIKDKYVHSGRIAFEVFTSEGNFQEFIELSVESTEIPF